MPETQIATAPPLAEDIPAGSIVLTPLGMEAVVIGHRGVSGNRPARLVCRYAQPVNRRHDVVQLLPALVKVVQLARAERPKRAGCEPVQGAKPRAVVAEEAPAKLVVTREGGVVRCSRVPLQDTEEAQGRERQRRERQQPPRPNKPALKRLRRARWLEAVWDDAEA